MKNLTWRDVLVIMAGLAAVVTLVILGHGTAAAWLGFALLILGGVR